MRSITNLFNRILRLIHYIYCIKNKIKCSDFVNFALELRKLKSDGWISDDSKLTSKSLLLMQEIDSFFKRSKKKTSTDLMGEVYVNNIESYQSIFPKVKLSSGKYARDNTKTLENAFRWFFENYDYSWDVVLEATQMYVTEYELKNYHFMRTSQYFIRKQNTDKTWDSDLATYCDIILSGADDINQTHFSDKVV